MKNIAIISSQYFWLPVEPGPSRFYSIAQAFQQAGYNVDIITSSFEHHEKKQRDKKLKSPFNIIYIDCLSYRKNIGVLREISNIIFAYKIKRFLKLHKNKYDIIYCSIPPNNIGAAVGKYCHKYHIPFVVDIEDLWPEAMSMIVPKLLRFLFFPYLLDAERTYRYADGVVGTSEEYSLRAMKNNKRKIPYITVYVGNDIDRFDNGVKLYSDNIKKKHDEIWVTYAGSLGVSYDIATMIRCAQKLYATHSNIIFQILGNGIRYDEFVKLSKEQCCNVNFWGYVQYEKMAAILSRSDILINSIIKNSSAGIINKIGDYLAAKKPMINTGSNLEFRNKVEKDNFGINVEAENVEALKVALISLIENETTRKQMGENARLIAEKQFDRKNTYHKIVDFAKSLGFEKGKVSYV